MKDGWNLDREKRGWKDILRKYKENMLRPSGAQNEHFVEKKRNCQENCFYLSSEYNKYTGKGGIKGPFILGANLHPINNMELGIREQSTKDKIWQCHEEWTVKNKQEARRPIKKSFQKSQYKVNVVQNEIQLTKHSILQKKKKRWNLIV